MDHRFYFRSKTTLHETQSRYLFQALGFYKILVLLDEVTPKTWADPHRAKSVPGSASARRTMRAPSWTSWAGQPFPAAVRGAYPNATRYPMRVAIISCVWRVTLRAATLAATPVT